VPVHKIRSHDKLFSANLQSDRFNKPQKSGHPHGQFRSLQMHGDVGGPAGRITKHLRLACPWNEVIPVESADREWLGSDSALIRKFS
jgi:hypothetical protein